MLNIKNPETYRLARLLADQTGESLTDAVTNALRARLDALRRQHATRRQHAQVAEIQAMLRDLPDRDVRLPDEILDYDEFGLPRQR